MTVGRNLSFNLVIDEFQEFFYINPAIYSGIQDVWDRYKDTTRVYFIASGFAYTLMRKIFMGYREPLYGRCDSIVKLKPFTTAVLKQILADYHPGYTRDDL
jgi:AAA+ ATPase superfamily predicted ATPase